MNFKVAGVEKRVEGVGASASPGSPMAGGMGPTAGAAHALGKDQFSIEDFRTYSSMESLLRSQLSNDFLLLVELYSTWVGTCAATKPILARLYTESLEQQQEYAAAVAASPSPASGGNSGNNNMAGQQSPGETAFGDFSAFNGGGDRRASVSSLVDGAASRSPAAQLSPATGGLDAGTTATMERSSASSAATNGLLGDTAYAAHIGAVGVNGHVGPSRVPVRVAAIDPERILKSLEKKLKAESEESNAEQIVRSTADFLSWQAQSGGTALSPGAGGVTGAQPGRPNFQQFVKKVFGPWRMTVIPVFLLLRKGQLLAVIEGPNAPHLESSVKHYSLTSAVDIQGRCVQPPPSASGNGEIGVGLTSKEANHYAFVIQTAWRRKLQLHRIGMFIDGTFYTHEEVRIMREKEERARREKEEADKRNRMAVEIQRVWRGYVHRKFFQLNKKTLLQKAKMSLSRQRGKKESLYAHSKLPASVDRKIKALRKHFAGAQPLTEDELSMVRKKLKFGQPIIPKPNPALLAPGAEQPAGQLGPSGFDNSVHHHNTPPGSGAGRRGSNISSTGRSPTPTATTPRRGSTTASASAAVLNPRQRPQSARAPSGRK